MTEKPKKPKTIDLQPISATLESSTLEIESHAKDPVTKAFIEFLKVKYEENNLSRISKKSPLAITPPIEYEFCADDFGLSVTELRKAFVDFLRKIEHEYTIRSLKYSDDKLTIGLTIRDIKSIIEYSESPSIELH